MTGQSRKGLIKVGRALIGAASLFLDSIGPFGVFLVGSAPATLLANPVVALVAGDSISPSRECGGIVQSPDVSADGDPCLLNRVPGGVATAGQTPGVAPEPFLPSADQLVKRVRITLLAAEHQQLVGGSFSSVHLSILRPLGTTDRFNGLSQIVCPPAETQARTKANAALFNYVGDSYYSPWGWPFLGLEMAAGFGILIELGRTCCFRSLASPASVRSLAI